jgi:hypothetical protein
MTRKSAGQMHTSSVVFRVPDFIDADGIAYTEIEVIAEMDADRGTVKGQVVVSLLHDGDVRTGTADSRSTDCFPGASAIRATPMATKVAAAPSSPPRLLAFWNA